MQKSKLSFAFLFLSNTIFAKLQKTDFYFEITGFEDKGDHIILSAKYSGKLYGLNLFKGLIGASCKDVVIKNGVINNLKVEKQ